VDKNNLHKYFLVWYDNKKFIVCSKSEGMAILKFCDFFKIKKEKFYIYEITNTDFMLEVKEIYDIIF